MLKVLESCSAECRPEEAEMRDNLEKCDVMASVPADTLRQAQGDGGSWLLAGLLRPIIGRQQVGHSLS